MNQCDPKRQSKRSKFVYAMQSTSTCAVLTAGLVLTVPWCAKAADSATTQRPWMNKSDSPEQRAALLVKAMTLDEEISMMHGVKPMPVEGYAGYVPAIARLGIPALAEADGRAGVGNQATQVTLLPLPSQQPPAGIPRC